MARTLSARVVCVALACLLAVAAATPTPPEHQSGAPQGSHGDRGAGLREACENDVKAMCADSRAEGPSAVFHCLAAHTNDISDACKAAIGNALQHNGQHGPQGGQHGPQGGQHGPQGGQHGPQGGQHGPKHGGKRHGGPGVRAVLDACRDDAKLVCAPPTAHDADAAGTPPPRPMPWQVLPCLRANAAKLGAKCTEALKTLPQPPVAVTKVLGACHTELAQQRAANQPAPPMHAADEPREDEGAEESGEDAGPVRRLRAHSGKPRGGKQHGSKQHGGKQHGPKPPMRLSTVVKALVGMKMTLTGDCAAAVEALPADWEATLRQEEESRATPAQQSGDDAWGVGGGDDFEGADEDGEPQQRGHGRHGRRHGPPHGPWMLVGIGAGVVVAITLIVAGVVVYRRRRANRARAVGRVPTRRDGFSVLPTSEPPSSSATVQGAEVAFA